jgi:hypothetical protein
VSSAIICERHCFDYRQLLQLLSRRFGVERINGILHGGRVCRLYCVCFSAIKWLLRFSVEIPWICKRPTGAIVWYSKIPCSSICLEHESIFRNIIGIYLFIRNSCETLDFSLRACCAVPFWQRKYPSQVQASQTVNIPQLISIYVVYTVSVRHQWSLDVFARFLSNNWRQILRLLTMKIS